MMKLTQTLSLLLLISFSLFAQTPLSIYEHKAQTIDGDEFDFQSLKGKKVLIVNVASKNKQRVFAIERKHPLFII